MSAEKSRKVGVVKRDINGKPLIIYRKSEPHVLRLVGDIDKESGKPKAEIMTDKQLAKYGLKKPEKPKSMFSSFLHGVLQDITFGFADETEARIRSFGKGSYKDNKKKVRERYDAHQTHNPWSYNIGNNVTLAIPGPGVVKGGLKLAGKAGKIALAKAKKGKLDDLAKLAYRKTGKGLKAATKRKLFKKSDVAKLAMQNAAAGAITAAGYAEDDPAVAAVMGGLTGGAIGGALGFGKLKIGNRPIAKKINSVDKKLRKEVAKYVKLKPRELEAIYRKNPDDINVLSKLMLKKGILNNDPDIHQVIKRATKLKKGTGETIAAHRRAMDGISQDELERLLRGENAEVSFFRKAAIDPIDAKDAYGNKIDALLGSLDRAFARSAIKNANKTMPVDDLNLFLQKRMDTMTDASGNPLKNGDDFLQGIQEFVSKIENPRAEKMGVLDDFTKLKDDYHLFKKLPDWLNSEIGQPKNVKNISGDLLNAIATSIENPPLGATNLLKVYLNKQNNSATNTQRIASLLKNRLHLVKKMEAEEAIRNATGLSKKELLKVLYGSAQSTKALFKEKELKENKETPQTLRKTLKNTLGNNHENIHRPKQLHRLSRRRAEKLGLSTGESFSINGELPSSTAGKRCTCQ